MSKTSTPATPFGDGANAAFEALRPEAEAVLAGFRTRPLPDLLAEARAVREAGHGTIVSYSRKVFIPLTRLCRDTCAYCTFATAPSRVPAPYLSPDEVLDIARAGQRAGCHEALFTLGDKPELRYAAARRALEQLGHATTAEYVEAMCGLVLRETGLLPHVNAGVMTGAEMSRLRAVSVSQGIMLENVSDRLCGRGGVHFGCPDKLPAPRLQMTAEAGRLAVPFTSGILIGIGETHLERIASLLALRDLNAEHGHIQEVIVQNFRAKPATRMAGADEPGLDDLLWTAAAARIVLGAEMNIQVPPNLSYDSFPRLLEAGINDWGGVSPVTPDHVNPEAPWPDLDRLQTATAEAGFHLVPRLALYPAFVAGAEPWVHAGVRPALLRQSDASGFARAEAWAPGTEASLPAPSAGGTRRISIERLAARATAGEALCEADIVALFSARAGEADDIAEAADALRTATNGNAVTYVVNRNINYTNVCTYKCGFCAFSKGKAHEALRGRAYDLDLAEVARRAREAWNRGATEVCMQGGINPRYTGDTYIELLRTVKTEVPDLHVHAFSPLEVSQGAATLGLAVPTYLERLAEAGLGSLPGTAAEILDDEVRDVICPDKLSAAEWLGVVEAAHRVGLRTTATIMFGHVDRPVHWARHLLAIRSLQERTGGFTEFVPLPFVHMEAPLYMRGQARKGPTWRETLLMHAVARLVLHPVIPNVQASWVKLGRDGIAGLLAAGVNDLGGTLMNESISRAAGTLHGQEFGPEGMDALIAACGRAPRQRTTLYGEVSAERHAAGRAAAALTEMVLTPFTGKSRVPVRAGRA